jgi:hypothetical protein
VGEEKPMNTYNINMQSVNTSKAYYGVEIEQLKGMMKKMYHDGKVYLVAWSYMPKDLEAQHILNHSAHYQMKLNWEEFFAREMHKLNNK